MFVAELWKLGIVILILSLICSDESDDKVWNALQELSSQDEYGTALARMVCFYLRLMDLWNSPGEDSNIVELFEKVDIRESQRESLQELSDALESNENSSVLDKAFHKVLKAFFCWIERRKLMEELECPVQMFLLVLCLRRDGNGFVNAQEVTPWISKLIYGIRATIWTELMGEPDCMYGSSVFVCADNV